MRSRRGAYESALSFRPLLQRALAIAAITLLIFILFSERSQSGFATSLRTMVMDGLVPVLDILSKPVDAVDHAADGVTSMLDLQAENTRLKTENERLLQWQSAALRFESENQALRTLLNYHPAKTKSYVTAKVIGNAGNSLAHRIRIDAGSAQGIRKYQAVMNEQGLVGRVIVVGKSSAEILLITDMNSRIPVMTDPSGLQAILSGDRSDLPYLALASARHEPVLGEMVVTSADGDIFPAGLPIGKVFSNEDGHWNVRPLVDASALRYVRVMAFDMPAAASSDTQP